MNTHVPIGAVVVGVDGSRGSEVAIGWAVGLAAERHRPLLIVHGTGAPLRTDFAADLREARQILRMRGRRITDHALVVARSTDPDLDVTTYVALEDPRELLIVAGERASVLVLGPRGHGPVGRLLLGSVSSAVVGHAGCPVVIARPDADDPTEPRPIVVGVDGTAASADAISVALELAAWQGRRLEIVHSMADLDSPYFDFLPSSKLHEIRTGRELAISESVVGQAEKFPDVAVHTTMSMDSPSHALTRASKEAHTVVLGSRGRSAIRSTLLGSVSRSVVEHAHCTVVVVPAPVADAT